MKIVQTADFLIILNSEIKCVSYKNKTVFKEYHRKTRFKKINDRKSNFIEILSTFT